MNGNSSFPHNGQRLVRVDSEPALDDELFANDNDEQSLLPKDKTTQKDHDSPNAPSAMTDGSYSSRLRARVVLLVGLLVFQSCSSFILASYEDLLKRHSVVVVRRDRVDPPALRPALT